LNHSQNDLLKILLQGTGRSGVAIVDSDKILREMAHYSLSKEWCFSSSPIQVVPKQTTLRNAGIKTYRYFVKSKEIWTPSLLNCFAWEHYKRAKTLHPLNALLISQLKLDIERLDRSLIEHVGKAYFQVLAKRKGRKNSILRNESDLSVPEDLGRKHFDSEADRLLRAHPEWMHLESWPKDVRQDDGREWFQVLSLASNQELCTFFKWSPQTWAHMLLQVGKFCATFAQLQLDKAIAGKESGLLNSFFQVFMELPDRHDWECLDVSDLLRALPLRHSAHAVSQLCRPSLNGARLSDLILLVKVNYHEWPASEIRKVAPVYQQIMKELGEEEALYWLELSAHRIETSLETEFLNHIQSNLKSEVTYRLLPKVRSIFQIRRDLKALFSS